MPVTPGELLVNQPGAVPQQLDAVVVGAGFSGLYLLHRLRQLGFSVKVFDSASDVGGPWYWNRYPGARCDIPTTDYTSRFGPELEKEWTWSEKYATQPEILDYLRFVADRYGLRSDIEFSTSVTSARWDEGERRWRLTTDRNQQLRCRYYIMASGCLSMPKSPDIERADRFPAQAYFTTRSPHQRVAPPPSRAPPLPAPPELLHPTGHRPGPGRSAEAAGRGPRRVPPLRQVVQGRDTRGDDRHPRRHRQRGGPPAALRGSVGAGRAVWHPRRLRRPGGEPGFQRDRGRDDPREDPLDREGSRDRRGALPAGPLLRYQPGLPRNRRRRDIQPPARPAHPPAE